MKKTGLVIAAMFTSIVLLAQTDIPLYNGSVPNSKPAPNKESSLTRDNVTRISKVSVPTLTIYKPATPNGMSVIICPGGGYSILAFDKEGTRVAEEMNKWGITAFVLKYRLPDDTTNIDRSIAPLMDAHNPHPHKPTGRLYDWIFLITGIQLHLQFLLPWSFCCPMEFLIRSLLIFPVGWAMFRSNVHTKA